MFNAWPRLFVWLFAKLWMSCLQFVVCSSSFLFLYKALCLSRLRRSNLSREKLIRTRCQLVLAKKSSDKFRKRWYKKGDWLESCIRFLGIGRKMQQPDRLCPFEAIQSRTTLLFASQILLESLFGSECSESWPGRPSGSASSYILEERTWASWKGIKKASDERSPSQWPNRKGKLCTFKTVLNERQRNQKRS